MHPPMDLKLHRQTREMMAMTALDHTVDGRWVGWALDMMLAGHDSPGLVRLAGECEPFQPFEMRALIRRTASELGLSLPQSREAAALELATVWAEHLLDGETDRDPTLRALWRLCIDIDMMPALMDFYLLYEGLMDLRDASDSYHWPGLTRHNADAVIRHCCSRWIANQRSNASR